MRRNQIKFNLNHELITFYSYLPRHNSQPRAGGQRFGRQPRAAAPRGRREELHALGFPRDGYSLDMVLERHRRRFTKVKGAPHDTGSAEHGCGVRFGSVGTEVCGVLQHQCPEPWSPSAVLGWFCWSHPSRNGSCQPQDTRWANPYQRWLTAVERDAPSPLLTSSRGRHWPVPACRDAHR